MCGLIGFSGKAPYNIDKLGLIMYQNYLERGKDSTGIYTPNSGLIKSLDTAEKFLIKNRKLINKDDKLFIGHVRAKTKGAVSVNNAHPFEYGDIVGAHNGTLDVTEKFCNAIGLLEKNYQVDSQLIFKSLSVENNPFVLTQFKGAAAILFTDKRDDIPTLYFYRNTERPLFYGMTEEGMYISSIEDSLSMIGIEDIKSVVPHYLYVVQNGDIIDLVKIKNVNQQSEDYFHKLLIKGRKVLIDFLKSSHYSALKSPESSIIGEHSSLSSFEYRNLRLNQDIKGFAKAKEFVYISKVDHQLGITLENAKGQRQTITREKALSYFRGNPTYYSYNENFYYTCYKSIDDKGKVLLDANQLLISCETFDLGKDKEYPFYNVNTDEIVFVNPEFITCVNKDQLREVWKLESKLFPIEDFIKQKIDSCCVNFNDETEEDDFDTEDELEFLTDYFMAVETLLDEEIEKQVALINSCNELTEASKEVLIAQINESKKAILDALIEADISFKLEIEDLKNGVSIV